MEAEPFFFFFGKSFHSLGNNDKVHHFQGAFHFCPQSQDPHKHAHCGTFSVSYTIVSFFSFKWVGREGENIPGPYET